MSVRYYIGTSGFSYNHWRNSFYPEEIPQKKWLEFYCERFSTVELNSTFYRLPSEKICAGWYTRTPENFIFSLKGSRFITHLKKLSIEQSDLDALYSRIEQLADKTGPILYQLPPSLHCDLNLLESFIKILPVKYRHCIEFRHKSWFNDSTYELLSAYNTGVCILSAPGLPCVPVATASFAYIRFHGISHWYSYNYTEDDIAYWSDIIRQFLKNELDVFAYFNNDFGGYAPGNALSLIENLKLSL